MGNQSSSLRRSLEQEFARLAAQGRKYLLLDQLLQLRLPPSAWTLDPSHLGVLFVLDRERCGRISLEDLLALAEVVRSRMRCYQPHEFQTQMQGYCTLQMWRAIAAEGEEAICRWLLLLFSAAAKTCKFGVDSDEVFLHEEGVRLLFVMLRVERVYMQSFPCANHKCHKFMPQDTPATPSSAAASRCAKQETQGVQFADCLNLLQRAGEDTGLMDIDDPRQDQWVPLTIVSRLLMALVTGMSKVMDEIYPREELALAQ